MKRLLFNESVVQVTKQLQRNKYSYSCVTNQFLLLYYKSATV